MDLGTNIFHLLIAEGDINNFKEIVHLDVAVKLGEGGINKGMILTAPFERGIATMKQFAKQISDNNAQYIKAIATSALRNASNGREFIDRVKAEAGIDIEIVDGDREASFIYSGVKASGLLSEHNSLIMDIGGGSVEFIIGNKSQLAWKQSFEIGAARLMERFHHTDPIPPASIAALNQYLEGSLKELFKAVGQIPVRDLVGSSGAFETFALLVDPSFDLKNTKAYHFENGDLTKITDQIIHSNRADREANKSIIPVRVDMIVAASLITRYIMQKLNLNQVALCTYSLKEGVLAEMMG